MQHKGILRIAAQIPHDQLLQSYSFISRNLPIASRFAPPGHIFDKSPPQHPHTPNLVTPSLNRAPTAHPSHDCIKHPDDTFCKCSPGSSAEQFHGSFCYTCLVRSMTQPLGPPPTRDLPFISYRKPSKRLSVLVIHLTKIPNIQHQGLVRFFLNVR